MKIARTFARTFLGAAIALAFSTLPAYAQQPSTGYHTVACFKVKPDSAAALHKFLTEDSHKVAQGRVSDGELTAWYLLRPVFPGGESAECDYLSISLFAKTPHTLGMEQLDAAIKKEGLTFTPDDYLKHRDAVAKLVSTALFQNLATVGAPKKGDYFRVNYMKVADGNFDDWIAYEKKVWQPIADALVKEGKSDGWSLNVRAMPFGPDLPFQGVTVDIFPSMDAAFADDPQFLDRFRKVHPDMEFGTTLEHFEKLRTQALIELYVLDDIVTAQ